MPKGMEVFSEAEDYGLQGRVDTMWEFVEGFPLPKLELLCACASTDIKVMAFSYCKKDEIHATQKGGQVNACCMTLRCWACGKLSHYTAAVPETVYEQRSDNGQASMYHWGKALTVIQEAK